ncbi:ABC transporter ATP-binding protein [Nocardioides sp. CFH 31398]|uniref:ABC transporter ATP-binding protein n=1 Tax=Nocardioides sp. CFH 31398 TaxID=2919579 RepID=UPI001F06B442|nr:ABC transporter ATP-binding protein [Nocardioides sp. CFH 31398]MCH1865411.1 ABC transporter ATP-binding protein/permease [Nocardioides sp. CFH 31398]
MSGPDTLPISTPREAARVAWPLLRRRPGALVATVVSLVLVGAAGLVGPFMLGRVVDVVDDGGDQGRIVVAAVWIALAAVVGAVATTVGVTALAAAGQPALAELREEVLDVALHTDPARIERAGSGDLLSRVGDDVRLISESLTEAVPLVVNSLVTVAFTAGGLFLLDWRLGLAGLAAAPAYVLGLRWYLRRSGPKYRAERAANGVRAQALVTGLGSSATLRAHGLAPRAQERIESTSWSAAEITLDVFRLYTRFGFRMNMSEALGLLLVLGVGFLAARADAVSVGEVTAAALFFHRLFNPVGALLFFFDDVQSAGASLTRLTGMVLMPRPARPADVRPPADAGVALRGITHAYVEDRPVVHGVDAVLAPGERVAVVGSTGAGKTTLAAVAAGRLHPTAGTVELGGVPLAAVEADGRPPVAVVTQEVHVYTGTVRDNLLLAKPSATDDELRAVLGDLGALGWVEALPDGLDTVVGEGGLELTPAQAQHLALARLPLADPLVAVLDEATAEAGSAGARDLERAASAATRGRTSLVVAHRLTQAAAADRVWVMHDGRVVDSGTHDELVAAGGRYAELWRAWSQR